VDCNLLIIAGPDKEVGAQELAAVEQYIDRGGKVVLLLEAGNGAGFGTLLEKFGVNFRADLIADDKNNLFGSNNLYPVLELAEHELTAPLKTQNMSVVFFKSSGLDIAGEPRQGWFLEPLLRTMAGGSWSESGDEEDVEMDPDEDRGPFTMAVIAGKPAAEEAAPDTEGGAAADASDAVPEQQRYGMILVTGDASFVANNYIATAGNKDFILNAVSYMTSGDTHIYTRPPSAPERLQATKTEVSLAFLVSTVFIPLIVAAFGIGIWWRRR
jgi:ABC-type uncharacterized transport system involved in gliding motility auxiliary subunit